MAGAYLDQFLRRRSSQPIFVKETSRTATGQPNYHTTNTPGVGSFYELVTVEPIDLSQSLNFSDITEIGDQLLNMRSVLNYAERSDNSFEMLMKLSGAAGQAPDEDFMLEQLFGKKTTYSGNFADHHGGGANVSATEYSFAYSGGTFQIAQIVDNYMLKVANGSYCSGGSMEISREGAFSTTFNTRSSQIRFAGSSLVTAIDDTAKTVTITNGAYAVFPGMQFQLTNNDAQVWDGATQAFAASGSVLKVASLNGDVATVTADDGTVVDLAGVDSTTPGASWAADGVCVVPFIHTNDTDAAKVIANCGEVVPQGSASIFLGPKDTDMATLFAKTNGTDYDHQFLGSAFSMTVEKNLGDPGVQELTGDIYPAPVYVAQDYSVTGSMSMIVRPKEAYRLNKALDDFEQSLAVVIAPSTMSTRKIILFMPRVRLSFSSQDIEGAEGANIDWMLTRPANCVDDSEVFKMVVI